MQSQGYSKCVDPLAAPLDGDICDDHPETWVLFLVDEQTYALRISEVERIVRAVEVRPLPESPPHILGVINIQGRVLPVVDLRTRFGRPSRDICLEDHFIVVHGPDLEMVLPVDAALGSMQLRGGRTTLGEEAPSRCVREVLTTGSEVIYALDLERLMFDDEEDG